MKTVRAADWALPDIDEDVVQACPHGERVASVVRLRLRGREHVGYPDAHNDLAVDASGRYHIVPGADGQLVVEWEIEGFQYVVAADLQIYALDGTPRSFIQVTEAVGEHETSGVPERVRGAPTAFTFSGGPYLVRIRITKVVQGTKVPQKARRIYFDALPVVVIGGGLAGIRAAQRLLEGDDALEVAIVEGRDYLGGRARTVPWGGLNVDLGCQFLQDASTNPLVGVATALGQGVFWHQQVSVVRVSVEDEMIDEDDDRWRAAEQRVSAECQSGDESYGAAVLRRLLERAVDEVQQENAVWVTTQTTQAIEQQAALLAQQGGFPGACLERATQERTAAQELVTNNSKPLENPRQEQLRVVRFNGATRRVTAAQGEIDTLRGGEPARGQLLHTLAVKQVKQEQEVALRADFKQQREQATAGEAARRAGELLANRLTRLAMAFNAELDEASEPATFTAWAADEEAHDEADEPEDGGDEAEDAAPDGVSNKMATGGYGAIVEAHATQVVDDHPERLSVLLSHVVSRVTVSGPVVRVATDRGTVYARAVVVAVPTEVIRRGRIAFEPALPKRITTAFGHLPMGNYKKIFLPMRADSVVCGRFESFLEDQEPPEDRQTDPSLFTITDEGVSWKFLYRRALRVVVGFVGGEAALARDAWGDEAVSGEALRVLAGALSITLEAARASWTGQVITSRWGVDPLSLGAYSYTAPRGGVAARATLRDAVVAGRIVFAGEALRSSKEEYATAHGAWLSGEHAAALLLPLLT